MSLAAVLAIAGFGAAPAAGRAAPLEAAWRGHEQSGPPLPPVEARPQATSGSDPAKSGEPLSARDRALRHALDRLLQRPGAADGFWGVYVYSLDRQRVLYDHNGGRWFTPASNAKLFTLAAALEKLGPQYRYHTVVAASAAPDAAGVIAGDLVLVGAGDPSLSGRVYPYHYEATWKRDEQSGRPLPPVEARPQATIGSDPAKSGEPHRTPAPAGHALELPYDPLLAADRLAQQVVARGITRIEGGVVGDDRYFADDPYGRGWAADDLAQSYGAPVSALTMNDNERFVELLPGAAAGAPAQIRVFPKVGDAAIESHVITGQATAVTISGLPGHLTLEGEVALGSSGDLEEVPVADPALYAAELLRQALVSDGVRVEGGARARHRPPGTPAAASGAASSGFTLATWVSPPLWELLQTTAKVSDNLDAELVLRLLGKLQGTPGGVDGEVAPGERVVEAFEHNAGLAGDDAELVDGSGLSRLDLVTPAGVVRLLRYMDEQPEAATWRSLFPVAGEDGTLAHRFLGTAAAGRLIGKTGSLTHVHCLSGYVTTRHGEHLAFAIFADNQGEPSAGSEAELDGLALALVE